MEKHAFFFFFFFFSLLRTRAARALRTSPAAKKAAEKPQQTGGTPPAHTRMTFTHTPHGISEKERRRLPLAHSLAMPRLPAGTNRVASTSGIHASTCYTYRY